MEIQSSLEQTVTADKEAVQTIMQDLASLIANIDHVINTYLDGRFEVNKVNPNTIRDVPRAEIINNLKVDARHYPKQAAMTGMDIAAWVFLLGPKLLYKAGEAVYYTTRSATNNDGRHRLPTLELMDWTRHTLTTCIEEEKTLKTAEEADALKAKLVEVIQDFLLLIARILDTAADGSAQFKVARGDREFIIWGLKNNTSDLNSLFRKFFIEVFDRDVLIHAVEEHFEERKRDFNVEPQPVTQTEVKTVTVTPSAVPVPIPQEPKRDLRALEQTYNAVAEVKSQLQKTTVTQAHLEQELEVTTLDTTSVQQRIQQLEAKNEVAQAKQTKPFPQDMAANVKAQRELEERNRALAEAKKREESLIAEKKALLEQLQREREQQEQIRIALEEAALKNQKLAEELEQPAAVLMDSPEESEVVEEEQDKDDLDVDALCQALQGNVNNSNQDTEEEDEFDVDALTKTLKANQPATEPATEEREFPLQVKAAKSGFTTAQLHVLNGELGLLRDHLNSNPSAVDTVSKAEGNGFNKFTLLELALFHNKVTQMKKPIPFKTRKAILEEILARHPDITYKHHCVLDMIALRLNVAKKRCHLLPDRNTDLVETFCQYAIAQRTCTAKAREDMLALLQKIDADYKALENSPLKVLLKGLKEPMEICDLLKQAYIDGKRLTLLGQRLKHERGIDNPEQYAVLLDFDKKKAADNQHLKKYKKPTLRMRLLQGMDGCVENTYKVASAGNKQRDQMDADVLQYRELVRNITGLIDRYGVVLDSKGFNRFQLTELKRQHQALAVLGQDAQHEFGSTKTFK